MKKALLIVDVQNDFCRGGSLEVPGANEIVPIINKLSKSGDYDLVIFTKDWHPANHKSFASQHEGKNVFETIDLNGIQQVLWPDHCIQNTSGSDFHPDLDIDIPNMYIFKKGMNTEVDSYSGFFDNDHKSSTGLSEFLKEKEITDVDIVGIALEYCVFYTSIDSVKNGFNTNLILNGTRSITKDGENDVLLKMLKNNVKIIQ